MILTSLYGHLEMPSLLHARLRQLMDTPSCSAAFFSGWSKYLRMFGSVSVSESATLRPLRDGSASSSVLVLRFGELRGLLSFIPDTALCVLQRSVDGYGVACVQEVRAVFALLACARRTGVLFATTLCPSAFQLRCTLQAVLSLARFRIRTPV